MKEYITYESEDFFNQLFVVYKSILKATKKTALLHVDTIESNNHAHWNHYIFEINHSIFMLKNLLPKSDNRRELIKVVNSDDYIKEAETFLNTDFL